MTDEMTVEEAIAFLTEQFRTFDKQDAETQAKLIGVVKEISETLAIADTKMKELERAKAARERETAADRKAVRDALIPQWCEENLKPGMVVKVKANSHRKLRQIESINRYGIMTGRHCHYDSRGQLIQDGYITDHVLRNVQGVVVGVDARGRERVVPIMELVEGVKNLNA